MSLQYSVIGQKKVWRCKKIMSQILDVLNLRCLGFFPVYLSRQSAAAYKGLELKRESLVRDGEESHYHIDGI